MAKRVEFLIPTGATEGKCRRCGAAIVWVPGTSAMMPLDLGSKRRLRTISRGYENRAESHFAHCPAAEEFRSGTPKALCGVKGCGASIPRSRHFCPPCWARVPRSVRGLLKESAEKFGPTDPRTLEHLKDARDLSVRRRLEEEGKIPTSLFGSGDSPPECEAEGDPG